MLPITTFDLLYICVILAVTIALAALLVLNARWDRGRGDREAVDRRFAERGFGSQPAATAVRASSTVST